MVELTLHPQKFGGIQSFDQYSLATSIRNTLATRQTCPWSPDTPIRLSLEGYLTWLWFLFLIFWLDFVVCAQVTSCVQKTEAFCL